MNISQIKVLTWLTATALAGALGWMIYKQLPEFRARVDPETGKRIWEDEKLAEQILNGIVALDEAQVDLVPLAQVQQQFHDLNWTGRIVQVVEAPAPVDEEPQEAPAVAMKELVRVLVVREHLSQPAHSTVHLIYKPAAGVSAAAPRASPAAPPPAAPAASPGRPAGQAGRGGPPAAALAAPSGPFAALDAMRTFRIGDHLDPPLDHIRIEDIRAVEGVTFSFGDTGREPETVSPRDAEGLASLLVRAERGEERRPASGVRIPAGDVRAAFGERTARVGDNQYRLGYEDMETIGRDYASIISREVDYRRYVDPKTKQGGILLTKVQPGGMAARHGVKEGDVIKSINGHPVSSPQEAITYVKNNADNYTTWHVVIENMGQEKVIVYQSP